MTAPVPDLLDRPAGPAAGAIALAFLDDAKAAAARLDDRTDREALHDLRVAIRRLRVTVRAYPGLHERVSKKQRRRLRRLARASNAARDAEVQISWFNQRSARFTKAQRAALAPLRARLRARRRRERAHTQQKLQRWFGKLEPKLRRRLTALQSETGAGEAPFRAVAGATLVTYGADLASKLGGTSPPADARALHATRIAAKRVRYLLEPMEGKLTVGGRLVARLKEFQDLLGALTDAHELERVLQDAEEGVGVTAAIKVLRADVVPVLTKLRAAWPATGPDLLAPINAVAQRLRPTPLPPPSLRRATHRRTRRTAGV
jgi:CHAD domain-containing protein